MSWDWAIPPEDYEGYENPLDALFYEMVDNPPTLDTDCLSCGYDCVSLFELEEEGDGVEGIERFNYKQHHGSILGPTYWSWTTQITCPRCSYVWEFRDQDY